MVDNSPLFNAAFKRGNKEFKEEFDIVCWYLFIILYFSTYIVDKNNVAINTVRENLKSLGIKDEAVVMKTDDFSALKSFINNIEFDLVILDLLLDLLYYH